jgi:hypothetical protein
MEWLELQHMKVALDSREGWWLPAAKWSPNWDSQPPPEKTTHQRRSSPLKGMELISILAVEEEEDLDVLKLQQVQGHTTLPNSAPRVTKQRQEPAKSPARKLSGNLRIIMKSLIQRRTVALASSARSSRETDSTSPTKSVLNPPDHEPTIKPRRISRLAPLSTFTDTRPPTGLVSDGEDMISPFSNFRSSSWRPPSKRRAAQQKGEGLPLRNAGRGMSLTSLIPVRPSDKSTAGDEYPLSWLPERPQQWSSVTQLTRSFMDSDNPKQPYADVHGLPSLSSLETQFMSGHLFPDATFSSQLTAEMPEDNNFLMGSPSQDGLTDQQDQQLVEEDEDEKEEA